MKRLRENAGERRELFRRTRENPELVALSMVLFNSDTESEADSQEKSVLGKNLTQILFKDSLEESGFAEDCDIEQDKYIFATLSKELIELGVRDHAQAAFLQQYPDWKDFLKQAKNSFFGKDYSLKLGFKIGILGAGADFTAKIISVVKLQHINKINQFRMELPTKFYHLENMVKEHVKMVFYMTAPEESDFIVKGIIRNGKVIKSFLKLKSKSFRLRW